MHKRMNEIEFIESIDACFPYHNQEKANEIIKFGSELSPNASFMVLHEICRASNEIKQELLFKYLKEWMKVNNHPLKKIVVVSAKALIEEKYIPNTQASEENEELENKYNQITGSWKKEIT